MFGIETGPASNLYRVVLAAHILLSIGGFGAVLLNGVYAAQAKRRPGPGARAISEANYAVSTIGEALILTVPVSGVALVWSSAGAWSFSDLWIWASLSLFVVAFAISRGVLMPAHRRINRLLAELDEDPTADPTPRLAEIHRIGKTSAGAGGALNVLLVVIVVLMIWKPGG